jgi:hypothetical protein
MGLCYLANLVSDISQQRELELADASLVARRVGPGQVNKLAVHAAAHEIALPGRTSDDWSAAGAGGREEFSQSSELIGNVVERRNLSWAHEGEVQGVEKQDDVSVVKKRVKRR